MRLNFVLLAFAALPSVFGAVNGRCSSGNGVCVSTQSCSKAGGSYVSGLCPNDPNNVKCCNKTRCVTNDGQVGSCKFTSDCNGKIFSGLCPGGTNFKCCVEKDDTTSGGNNGGNKSANLRKAEAAADYAKSKAHPKSTGYCAKYVANALQNAGFKFTRQGSACFYHTKGILKGMGFSQISKPGSLKKGDIAVHGCNGSHPHGHIQIYNGGKWYSDFAQNSVNVYKSNSPPVYYYRV